MQDICIMIIISIHFMSRSRQRMCVPYKYCSESYGYVRNTHVGYCLQVAGAAASYTLELPGYGHLFEVPPQYQPHINEETWQGIAVTARLSRALYRDRYNAANAQP